MRRMSEEEEVVGGGCGEDLGGGAVLIRIHVPDLNIHKCLQFYRHDLVWDVKQQCLASLPKELKESFNYGLFAPPCNGKVGKFLDEERPLSDYPFNGPVGYLELRYKRRLYKGLHVEEKQLKQLHTKSNLKRFLDYVSSGHCDKITKMCAKGLDPNFYCQETGETPLSMAALMKKPSKLLMALVNGGALLDYRTRDGATAMHRAVEAKSFEAVKTMLDLGGSPNYKDCKNLTPLYLSVAQGADPAMTQLLLHDHAFIGSQDLQGWAEVHQACRTGLVQHLEHLLYYGADMNARNASGNTPLHVCAVNNQESCARLLLFRGADKDALNFANQTPYQMAVIAGNMDLADIIQSHKSKDVVPYRELPSYNPSRRGNSGYLLRGMSQSRLSLASSGSLLYAPSSPSPSNRSSIPRFSSASSTSSRGSYSSYSLDYNYERSADVHSDITSDSSGVGTCNSGGSSYADTGAGASSADTALILPGTMVVAVENWVPKAPNHLKLAEGDVLEVTGVSESGLLEGSLRGVLGLFPPSCVQEIRMNRPHQSQKGAKGKNGSGPLKVKKLGTNVEPPFVCRWGEPHTVILHRGQKGFGFILRGAKADSPLMELTPSERFPALQYLDDVDEGGVADRAGLRKGDFILAINGMDVSQHSHEIVVEMIRKSAELVSMTVVGLSRPQGQGQLEEDKPGSPASLDQSGTPKAQLQNHYATLPRKYSGSAAPMVPSPPRRDPATSLSVGRARAKSMVAALADMEGSVAGESESGSVKSSSVDSVIGKPPIPPTTTTAANPSLSNGNGVQKTASIRSRPTSSRITASEIQQIFSESGKCGTWNGSHKIYASVSKMKRSKSAAVKGKDALEGPTLHKDFHSTPDLKELAAQGESEKLPKVSLSQENLALTPVNSRHSWAADKLPAPPTQSELEASVKGSKGGGSSSEGSSTESEGEEGVSTNNVSSKPKMPEGEYRAIKPLRPVQSKTLPRRASTGCTISPAEQQTIINLIPPGQVIKVDVSKSNKDYDIVGPHPHHGTLGKPTSSASPSGVMSSFKPLDNAKLYASPDDLRAIGYHRENQTETTPTSAAPITTPTTAGTAKGPRSQSLPPPKEHGKMGGGDYAEPGSNNTNGKAENFLQEAKEKLRPVKPVLKQPSLSEKDKIRIEVKASPRLSRKSEKTVTFQNAEDSPPPTPPPPPSCMSSNHLSHSMSVDEISKLKSGIKASKSFPNDLGDKEEGGGGDDYVTTLPVDSEDSAEDSSDKTWVAKEENGPSSTSTTTSDSVQTIISVPPSVVKEEKISNLSHAQQEPVKKALSASAQLGITHNFEALQAQHHQLYGRLGESHGTYGTISRGTITNMRPSSAGKSAVSLAKLPPPLELESEGEDGGRGTPVGKKGPSSTSSGQGTPNMYHTLQPQRSRSMLTEQPQQLQHQYHLQQQQIAARQLQALQGQIQGQSRTAEKSIEESLKLIQMHVAALKQDFPSVVPPPAEFGARNQTPILAPPPEFSDARDTHEAATRFNQGHMLTGHAAAAAQVAHAQQQQAQFNRQSPMYRSVSHAHSSTSSMYSGYPTMTRQQYQQQLHQLQAQHAAVQAAQHHQQLLQSQAASQHASYAALQASRSQQQAQATYGTTGGVPVGGGGNAPQQSAYSHYGTTQKSGVSQSSGTPPAVPQTAPPAYGHHPKCYYYQQTPTATASATNSNSAKLHPVHRYTPDLYESTSGPRIVGTIPKKQTPSDHYEVPHSHQQLLQQQQQQQLAAQQMAAQQQKQQQQQGVGVGPGGPVLRVRREFRNKPLGEWSVNDTCDWLESLFMPEYKGMFSNRGIDGTKLLRMDNATLLDLGVKKLGHRMNIEKSLKRYLPQTK